MKDEFFIDAIRERVTARTKLVLLERITSPTALVLPIDALVAELEGRGIPVLVDAAHAPGQVPLHLEHTKASFTTGNLHKWVCAPKGSALLHVREDWQSRIHPTTISHGANSPRSDRSKFQLEFDWVGTDDPTAYFCVPTALATMGGLVAGGWPALMERNREDALEIRQRLMHVLPQELSPAKFVGSMASIVVPGPHARVERSTAARVRHRGAGVPVRRSRGAACFGATARARPGRGGARRRAPKDRARCARGGLACAR